MIAESMQVVTTLLAGLIVGAGAYTAAVRVLHALLMPALLLSDAYNSIYLVTVPAGGFLGLCTAGVLMEAQRDARRAGYVALAAGMSILVLSCTWIVAAGEAGMPVSLSLAVGMCWGGGLAFAGSRMVMDSDTVQGE